jgi:hypothetical protein
LSLVVMDGFLQFKLGSLDLVVERYG